MLVYRPYSDALENFMSAVSFIVLSFNALVGLLLISALDGSESLTASFLFIGTAIAAAIFAIIFLVAPVRACLANREYRKQMKMKQNCGSASLRVPKEKPRVGDFLLEMLPM